MSSFSCGHAPGEVATHHVAHGVAAGFARGQADRREEAQDLGRLLELDEVELHVLAGREVTPPARVGLRDVGARLELLGREAPVRHLDAEHLVVAALALAVDALVQAEDPEDVFVDPPVEVLADGALVGVELLGDGRVEDSVGQLAYVDRHAAAPGSGRGMRRAEERGAPALSGRGGDTSRRTPRARYDPSRCSRRHGTESRPPR